MAVFPPSAGFGEKSVAFQLSTLLVSQIEGDTPEAKKPLKKGGKASVSTCRVGYNKQNEEVKVLTRSSKDAPGHLVVQVAGAQKLQVNCALFPDKDPNQRREVV